jgi:hypothetical protein
MDDEWQGYQRVDELGMHPEIVTAVEPKSLNLLLMQFLLYLKERNS